MPAFYANSARDFILEDPERILGVLTSKSAHAGFYQQKHAQTESWSTQINLIKNAIAECQDDHALLDSYVLLEYPVPRRGTRIDCVLLAGGLIIVLEFKIGRDSFQKAALQQLEDYCLDLRDFHAASFGRTIVPVLVSSDATNVIAPEIIEGELVTAVWQTGAELLSNTLNRITRDYCEYLTERIDRDSWNNSSYQPTPTIIQAAQALYAGQNVREITRCQAGIENLSITSDAALRIVKDARNNHEKVICFITGVPGAGKTLAGLNIVHNPALHDDTLGVLLSGNGPLVAVLREALARDESERKKVSLPQARRRVKTFIQNVHHFLEEYYGNNKHPVDRVIVFDEAQRAWDADQSKRKFHRDSSEPRMMLEIMDRHPDWAVIVALVGGGQEINRGEAGLSEWGRALQSGFSNWKAHVSPQIIRGDPSTGGDGLIIEKDASLSVTCNDALHLSVPVRSYRAQRSAEFVEALLSLQPGLASVICGESLQTYPIRLTRDLTAARKWLATRQRGFRRTGLVASSGARRLKPYGLDVRNRLDVAHWFLNDSTDVRASSYLEDPATEFDIQGLEVDFACLCWGGDFRFEKGRWGFYSFSGTRWLRAKKAAKQRYILNKYRVLLTRAREGLIIWVPEGSQSDKTRPPEIYDATAQYLTECGISMI